MKYWFQEKRLLNTIEPMTHFLYQLSIFTSISQLLFFFVKYH